MMPVISFWNLMLLLFLFKFGIRSVATEGPPRKLAIADHNRIKFAQVNHPTVLRCPVEETEFTTYVDWFRGNLSLYLEQGYELTKKGALKIKSVSKQHAGTYTCEGINGHGAVRVNITLIVDNPEVENVNNTPANPNSANQVHGTPPIIKKRPSTGIIDDVDGQATFHCIASGQPTPHIFWLKDGHLIQEGENEVSKGRTHSTLRLRRLQKSDAGIYKCIARNKMGEHQMDFTLHVTDPSSPPRIVSLEPPSVTIKEGAAAVFWCDVESRPGLKLHIKWLKRVLEAEIGEAALFEDSTLFRSGTTYYRPLNLSHGTSGGEGVYKSKLLIQNSRKEDSGTYVCLALNDKGFNFKNVTLSVIGTEKPPSSSSPYFATTYTSLVVTVTVAFVIVLAAIVLLSHFYCKGRSPQKKIVVNAMNHVESGNFPPNSASVRKHAKKDYPEVIDPQSTSKLLSSDSIYIYDPIESQASKLEQVKSYLH